MSAPVFGSTYSSLYDSLYESKPYEKECDFVESLFRREAVDVHTILDLGCGTAGHMIPLLKRGYAVTGVDRSEHMLDAAREKLRREGLNAELIQGDICTVALDRRFDAVISMFSVVGYLTTNEQIAAFCRTSRSHVAPGGIVVFDAWHGPSVLTHRPAQRVRTITQGPQQIIRITDPTIDVVSQVVDTRFSLTVIEDDRVVSRTDERHLVRYFFAQELAYFCSVAGLKRTSFCPFMKSDAPLTEDDWYLTAVCRCE